MLKARRHAPLQRLRQSASIRGHPKFLMPATVSLAYNHDFEIRGAGKSARQAGLSDLESTAAGIAQIFGPEERY